MTREQLIREMIQIELLYQARQKILKEEDQANDSDDEEPVDAAATITSKKKKVRNANEIAQDVMKKHHQLYSIGNASQSDYINNLDTKILGWASSRFKNVDEAKNKIILDGVYLNDTAKNGNLDLNNLNLNEKDKLDTFKKKITELTYDEIKSIMPSDIDKIWEFLEHKMHFMLGIPSSALKPIIEKFKIEDMAMNGKIFSIFGPESNQFNLQGLNYADGLEKVAANINSTLTNNLCKEIYKNKSKDDSQTFNSGKGEFLTVLLIDGAQSGGTQKLDVIVGNEQFDVKQISQHKKKSGDGLLPADYLALTLSEKSGLRDPKNKFIAAQSKLGEKISQLSTELEKLGVSEKLIKKLKDYDGYTSSAFRKSSTEDLDISSQYLSFHDLSEAITQGLRGLTANTYTHIKKLKDFTANTFNTSTIPIPTAAGPAGPITNNINPEVISFLKDIYGLELKTFNKIKEENDNDLKFIEVKNSLGKVLFKKLDVDNYNALIDNNIKTEYASYFKINQKYTPIIILTVASGLEIGDFDIFKSAFNEIPEFNALFSASADKFKKSYGTIEDDNGKNLRETFRSKIACILNNQIVLNINQMKKINSIIEKNDNITLGNEKNIVGINNNSIIDNQYFVTEPLIPTENLGEFIIDISYYDNMKKKHVDTLYSQDFKIDSSTGDKLKKVSKSEQITNDDNNKSNIIQSVKIDLENVISDRDTINNKLKNFQLFDNLQPSVLKDLLKIKNNKTSAKTSDFLSDNSSEIFINLKSIKDKTKEDNILNIIYEMYTCCNDIENKIIEYYIKENGILIFKDDGTSQGGNSIPSAAYSWETIVNDLKSKKIDSFVMAIDHDTVTCYADNNVATIDATKFDSVKNLIKNMFNKVVDLMLDLQSITPKA